MKKEIPTSKKSTEDAKRVNEKKTRAERKAESKVDRHVEKAKPGPTPPHVDSAPDSDPSGRN